MGRRRRKKGINGLNKKKVIIVVGLAAAVAIWYFSKNLTRISLGATSPRIHKLNLSGIEIRIAQQVLNESNLDIDVQSFLGSLFYRGTFLGTINQVAPVTLYKNSTGLLEYAAKVGLVPFILALDIIPRDNLDITNPNLNFLLAELQNRVSDIDFSLFRIKGTLKAENFSIPIDQPLLI